MENGYKMKKTFKNTLIILGLIFLGCNSYTIPSAIEIDSSKPVNIEKNELKILSWNIQMLPIPYGWIFSQHKRANGIIKKLQESEIYDIIVFQEAFNGKIREQIFEGLRSLYPFQVHPNDRSSFFKTNSGLWALSRSPVELVDELTFTTLLGWDWMSSKGAKLYRLFKSGQEIFIINTHLQADSQGELSIVRTEQYGEIKTNLIEPLGGDDTPLILCGDLNISKLTNLKLMLHKLGMKNGHLLSKIKFSNFDTSLENPKQLLDYILVKSNSFEFQTVQRRILEFSNFTREKSISISDHNPVEAILTW